MTEEGNPTTTAPKTGTMKRTLNLTSLLVNAMALIAPGAFLWTDISGTSSTDQWGCNNCRRDVDWPPGRACSCVFNRYILRRISKHLSQSRSGSSYYYAEASFLEKEKAGHRQWARVAKFLVGWISHLYYWIYPGIMVAFSVILIVYIFGLFGIALSVPEQILVAILFALLNGYIAYRGITGSTMTAIVINTIQLVALIGFSILAILYRETHPNLVYATSVSTILIPHNFTNLLFQSTIAILLLVGFESVTSLGLRSAPAKTGY